MYLERGTKNVKKKMLNKLTEEPDNYEEVGYWRKANQIHGWFVDNVMNGEDKCKRYKVTEEQLKLLLEVVNIVLNNHDLAEEYLPPREGFMFGDYEVDEEYFEYLEETKQILELVFKGTNFKTQEITYLPSW